jgi:hypothetical protein
MDNEPGYQRLLAEIRMHQRAGEVAEFFEDESQRKIELRAVGHGGWVNDLRSEAHGVEIIPRTPGTQAYYFLSSEVRPGSGIIRFYGGRPQGPGGTLTCFLSSKDGRDRYFAAAGHVLSNFWNEEDLQDAEGRKRRVASIYRYQKGFPASNSTRFLGKLLYVSDRPQPINGPGSSSDHQAEATPNKDIGIVEISSEVRFVQRTTCYGTFGDRPRRPSDEAVAAGQPVMKCGAEETHHTYAEVETPSTTVNIYGPDGLLYEFRDQAILRTVPTPDPPKDTNPPDDWSAKNDEKTPFAVAGDSGTMVVDRESRRPVGMLIAGSVLDGRYVMTPIQSIAKFWEDKCFVLLRA